jgi:putative endonuclease
VSRPARRRRAERAGRLAEHVAAGYLRLKGYRIVSRRYRTPVGEVDLVARRGAVIAFVEVKMRANPDDAVAAIGPEARRRIAAAAEVYLATHPEFANLDHRFDAVIIAPWSRPWHIVAAWETVP